MKDFVEGLALAIDYKLITKEEAVKVLKGYLRTLNIEV